MAKYPAVITTLAGINAVAEANATRQALIFTKILIGAGNAPASVGRATALTDKRLELEITKRVKSGDGQFTVQGLLTNKSLTNGFYAKEIGLMAKVGDSGREILFSYTNGGNYVDYIPDKNTPIDSYTFTVTTVVGNAEHVEAIVPDNGVASVQDLNTHNSDNNAHAELLKLFLRLTGGELTGDLIIKNHLFKLKNVNNKEMLIRFNNDNTLDIGNAYNGDGINGISLCSIKRPGWYNGIGSTKGFALLEELEPIKTLLGQGAIVASKLDATGFVKFANGFIIQWGSSGDDNSAKSIVTYPIAFKQVFISCAIDAFWEGSNTPKYLANSANESTNTRAVFVGNDQYVGSYYWFAFGMA